MSGPARLTSLLRVAPTRWLQVGAVAVLWGRAWQHLWHDAPFRALLWHERIMSPLIELLGLDWQWWVRSAAVDHGIQTAIRITGVLYVLAGFVALFAHRPFTRKWRWLVGLAGFSLLLLAWMYWLEHWRHLAQFLEYALQVAFPLLLWRAMGATDGLGWTAAMSRGLRVAVALTFAAHGLYALGVYPVPGSFVKMTTNILPLSENGARTFLLLAGVMDQIVAVGIFLPFGKWRRALLLYAVVWGLLTAMARPVAWVYAHDLWHGLSLYLPMMVYRLPHAIGPLVLLLEELRPNPEAAEGQGHHPCHWMRWR